MRGRLFLRHSGEGRNPSSLFAGKGEKEKKLDPGLRRGDGYDDITQKRIKRPIVTDQALVEGSRGPS
jgi:hypothetical protein